MGGFKTDRGADDSHRSWMAKESAQKSGQDWLWEAMS